MRRWECEAALDQLLAYSRAPDLPHAALDTALGHVRACPHCASRLAHLVRALASDREDELTCQACQDLLPEYHLAELAGPAGETRWRAVAFHLAICPHCSATYTALLDLDAFAFGDRGEEPPGFPEPDLSFVQIPWHLDELGRLIIEFSTDLVRAFRPPAIRLAYAPAGLKADESRRTVCRVSLKGLVEDLEVTITAEETQEDADLCTVVVEVNIPSRGGWPNLADMEVTIGRGDKDRATQWTDHFGKAVFRGIATDELAHLVFEISPGRRETGS